MVGAGPGGQVAVGQPGGLGAAGVDHPHRAPFLLGPQPSNGVGQAVAVAVGHHRVRPHQDEHSGGFLVPHGGYPRPAPHELGHQRAHGGVDGGGGVFLAGADGTQEPLCRPASVGVISRAAGQVHGHRVRAAFFDDGGQAAAQVVKASVPPHGLFADLRSVEPVRVVVPLGQRPAFRAGVALGDGVGVVASYLGNTRSPSTVTVMPHMAVQMRQKE